VTATRQQRTHVLTDELPVTNDLTSALDRQATIAAAVELRHRADKFRNMANAAVTKAVAELLMKTSREYGEQAANLEAKLKNTSAVSNKQPIAVPSAPISLRPE
jgi:hypothetical protein